MAEQSNISQILAALGMLSQETTESNVTQLTLASTLAAQRPGGTPNQGPPPQQPVPQPYQPSYPNAVPPGVPGVYPLPLPSTSGSVDLSNIKPSNSGSVSLADAVARARGIALEKGISYDAGRGGE